MTMTTLVIIVFGLISFQEQIIWIMNKRIIRQLIHFISIVCRLSFVRKIFEIFTVHRTSFASRYSISDAKKFVSLSGFGSVVRKNMKRRLAPFQTILFFVSHFPLTDILHSLSPITILMFSTSRWFISCLALATSTRYPRETDKTDDNNNAT